MYERSSRPLVLCPTRNRPEQLARTVAALVRDIEESGYRSSRVVVVDDSASPIARARNRQIVQRSRWARYHGPEEQRRLLARLINFRVIDAGRGAAHRFLRLLAGTAWDLGGVRNYLALLAVLLTGSEDSFVAMIDDDVELGGQSPTHEGSAIGHLWDALTQGKRFIVGGCLSGMPDLSIVERAELDFRRAEGLEPLELCEPPFPVSGGLMACRREWLTRTSFPRSYNEDWIWLAGCSWHGAETVRTTAYGTHAWSAAKHHAPSDLDREMSGEVLCSGFVTAYESTPGAESLRRILAKPSFWQEVIRDELDALERRRRCLHDQAKQGGFLRKRAKIPSVMSGAVEILAQMDAEQIAHGAKGYLRNNELWRRFLRDVESWAASGHLAAPG